MTSSNSTVNEGQGGSPQVDDLSSVGLRLVAIEERLHSLCELFNHKILFDEAKERAFNTLYDKMGQSQADYQSSLKKGMVLSLLLLHDRMQKAQGELGENVGAQRILHLRKELLDILYAEGVEPIEIRSEVFDRSQQETLETVPTMDPSKNNTVDRLIRDGFLISGKVLRPQTVIVRRYQVSGNEEKAETKGE
jgi:molecular chaperone GrpE (heat shock protein)